MANETINSETEAEKNKLWIISGHAYSRTGVGHYNLNPALRRGTKKAFDKMVEDFIVWLEDTDILVYPDDGSEPKTIDMTELEPEGIFSDEHQEAMSAKGNTEITVEVLRSYLDKTHPESLFAQQTGSDDYIDIQMTEAEEEEEEKEYIKNAVWDMTKKQFDELKDDLIAMDGDDRILGNVYIGSLRLVFDVEAKETRQALGVAPKNQRVGVLLLATGERSDGFVNYTDLGDFTYDELRKAMKGRFDTVYDLTFNGFRQIAEKWIVDTVHDSKEFKSGEINDSVFNRPIPKWQR